ncbi:MAG TPA: hypothetical protein VHC19_14095 [Pirellulales bacterium]|nr:hypothetical protein [Pirellulales bacterium]
MHVRKLNRKILKFPESHIARRFLDAFIGCRRDCVGIEACDDPIDQTWFSAIEAKQWSYAAFAYKFLSFDIELDGWQSDAPEQTESERFFLAQLPRMRELLRECEMAAAADDNRPLMPVIAKVRRMLDLWEQCILERTERDGREECGKGVTESEP